MDAIAALYGIPFGVLRAPNVKVRKPSIQRPSWKLVFGLVMVSYFLVTGGIIYGAGGGEDVVP